MTSIRIPAAGGALLVNGLVLVALATLAGPTVVDQVARPIEVAILPPPPPAPPPTPPAAKPEPPKPEPPKPEPIRKTPPPEVMHKAPPPKPTPAPVAAPQPAPTPAPEAPPVVAGKAIDAPRPSGITAEAAPSAPPAPVVTAPPAPPAPPQKEGVREDASWAGNVLPTYPAIAKRLGEQGTVKLLLKIGPEGTVLEAKMVQSSGSPALDAKAVETYRKWRFKPATVDGKPVTDWYPINFRFTLDE